MTKDEEAKRKREATVKHLSVQYAPQEGEASIKVGDSVFSTLGTAPGTVWLVKGLWDPMAKKKDRKAVGKWLPLPLAEVRMSAIANKSLKVCLELVDGSHDELVLSTNGNIGFHLGQVEPLIPSQWCLTGANLLAKDPCLLDVPSLLAFCKYCAKGITTRHALIETRISVVFRQLLADNRRPPVADPVLKEALVKWRAIFTEGASS